MFSYFRLYPDFPKDLTSGNFFNFRLSDKTPDLEFGVKAREATAKPHGLDARF